MKVIDGNHRIAALKASDKEAGRPPSMVMVRVHDPMEVSMTKMVAEGMNKATATLVEPLLVDELSWHRSVVQAEQQKDKALGHTALCTKLAEAFLAADRNPPSRATLLKYVKIATSFKEAALLAMKDVTYLNTREKGHSDFTFIRQCSSCGRSFRKRRKHNNKQCIFCASPGVADVFGLLRSA